MAQNPKFYYTSTQLLASIKRRAFVPESQTTFSDQDFLDFATEEMNMGIVPSVIEAQQDYYLYEQVIPLTSTTTKYEIPYRAIGNKIRDISFVQLDPNGRITSRAIMTRMGIADQVYNNSVNSDKPYAYFMTGSEINLIQDPNTVQATNTGLAVSYYLRPNTLVPNDEVAVIASMATVGNTVEITVSNFPDKFQSGILIDFIRSKSPHSVISFDITPTAFDSVTKKITFNASDLPSVTNIGYTLQAGDYIALATETCVPQIPSDLHVMLAVRVASQILSALGDTEGLQTSNAKLSELETNAKTMITERVEDSPMKIVNRAGSIRRSRSYRGYRGRG